MINCRDIASELPLYFDGFLAAEELAVLDEHLAACPLCRQKLDEYREIRAVLNRAPFPAAPVDVIDSVRASVAYSMAASVPNAPSFRLLERPRDWFRVWLFPSSVGSLATLLFAFLMMWFFIASATGRFQELERVAEPEVARQTIFIAGGTPLPADYAAERRDVSAESPSVNPQGSLVELTRALTTDDIHYDEVVVVADVYENGSARIASVVEPSRDTKTAQAIERALESELAYAPFVPAYLDNRAETVRVVLRLQSVSVR